MKIEGIVKAKFIRRPNRFQGYVILDKKEILVAVPNTGRCKEILIEGTTVILREGKNPNRKTKYDLIAGYKGDKLINIDSQAPNKIVMEALQNKKIPKLQTFNFIEREKTFGNSRFDFRLSKIKDNKNHALEDKDISTDNRGKKKKAVDKIIEDVDKSSIYYLEVKGITLEEDKKAKFPDAPTKRGARHLMELVEAKKQGYNAGVIFLMQMDDIEEFSPFQERDKEFSDALRFAKEEGVDIFAYQCIVKEDEITLSEEVRVKL